METDRTLSRPTQTVQDMTVDSAKKPILPSVTTLHCGLRPSPGTTAMQPTQRRERYACTGVVAHLTVLRLLVRTSILRQAGTVKYSAAGGGLFIPRLESRGFQARSL
jgi:hypothetical protein